MKQFKYITFIMMLFSVLSINAQEKLEKISKSINVNKDVTIDLNTSYTNIEIETWNKDIIEVEAYIESSKLSKEELQKALKAWDIEVEGSGDQVSIRTSGHGGTTWDFNFINNEAFGALEELQFELADMPEMPEMPEIPEMNFEMPEMPELPELPELPEDGHSINFDIDRYKKDGEKYLEKWSKEYEKKYGKDYKEKMKTWAKEFSKTDFDKYSKEMEIWGEKFGKNFGEKFGKDMEKWGAEFEKKFENGEWAEKMEAWGERFGEQFGKQMEERSKILEERLEKHEGLLEEREQELEERLEERLINRKNHKVKKTIKIKMPKKAKLKMNVRHGELKLASLIHNLKADLSHSNLFAENIDGSRTSINASYSPVFVKYWNAGELQLNYVEEATLQHVKGLMLGAKSSNINIINLSGNAIIDGSFGDLAINNILKTFNNINIVLENSDAIIKLPNTDFNFQYKGNRSFFNHPESSKENASSFSTGDLASGKTIVVNAKFSEVVMQ